MNNDPNYPNPYSRWRKGKKHDKKMRVIAGLMALILTFVGVSYLWGLL